jgi:hypothetical protein
VTGNGADRGLDQVWHRAGRWVTAAVLLALAPLPVTVGRTLLADRGATPLTASAVAIAAAATVACLVGSVTALRLAYRPVRDERPTQQSARHSARGPARRVALLPKQERRRSG